MMNITGVSAARKNISVEISVKGTLPNPSYSITGSEIQQSEGAFEIDFKVTNRDGIAPQVLKRFEETVMLGRTFPGTYTYHIRNNGELVTSGQIDLT